MSENSLPPPTIDEGNESAHSSSSSFVPVSVNVKDAVHVINENKEFNSNLLNYIESATPSSVGNNYHIISVFGSQSTGKSTLLNTLFYTNFDVMDESNRQQTTKGIWLASSPQIRCNPTIEQKPNMDNVFVMDVEGTDGRERGEDQDFERKAALFALSTSEVLIINTWETQIGLYQGANMGLLKTVFEVNLSLFGRSKLEGGSEGKDHKVLLLFVIRDHVGVTPKSSLAETLKQDMAGLWKSLNKPADLVHLQFNDFFDVSFHTIAHKILQPDKFLEDVQLLGDKFADSTNPEYIFKPVYHHSVPIDGWTMYAEQCWDQIDNNKDLDLPTQQILVAKFKCDEILNSIYSEFLEKFEKVNEMVSGNSIDFKELGLFVTDLTADTLENYDTMASRYNKSVYESKRFTLESKIDKAYGESFNECTNKIFDVIVKEFKDSLKKKSSGGDFVDVVTSKKTKSISEFENTVSLISLNGKFKAPTQNLNEKLDELIAIQQVNELNNFVKKAIKKLGVSLAKFIPGILDEPEIDSWDVLYAEFTKKVNEQLIPFESTHGHGYDFKLGTSEDLNNATVKVFKFQAWTKFHEVIKKFLSKESFLVLLKERFDNKFRYDENGLPRIYQNELKLEKNFKLSKEYALKIVPFVTCAKLKDGSTIKPEYDIFDKRNQKLYSSVSLLAKKLHALQLNGADDNEIDSDEHEDDEDDEDDDEEETFANIINDTDKSQVLAKFKKETDAIYVETNRSLVQHITQIPYWIYIVILVLGWNEFMAVIRNPFTFSLLLIFGAGIYAMYTLNLLRPAIVLGQRLIDEVLAMIKAKAKGWILDEHEFHGRNLNQIAKNEEFVEEIELDEFGEK